MFYKEFISINDDNILIFKAKYFLEEVSGYFARLLPGFVGFINTVDHHFVANNVILSFKN
jgi:hypothetical protein